MSYKLSFLSPRKYIPETLLQTASFTKGNGDLLSEKMWKESLEIAENALQTCHIQGIKYGDLDPNKYGSYTIQDAVYCYRSTEQYKRLAESAKDMQIKEFAKARFESYEKYTKNLFEQWCISDPSSIKLAPEIQKYITYKSEILDNCDPLYFLIANIPCLRLWCWLANKLKSRMEGPANLYSFWIRDNLGDESVRRLESFIDSRATQINISKAISTYRECMKGEFEFFALAGKLRYYLQEGDFLLPGDVSLSPSQSYELIYQHDGNLVVYESKTGKPAWASETQGKRAWRTYMQEDGNFVVYVDYSKSVWSSGVYSPLYKGSQLLLEDSGKLVIRKGDNTIWSS